MTGDFVCSDCGHTIDGPDDPTRRALVDYHMRNRHGMTHRIQKASVPRGGRKSGSSGGAVGEIFEVVADAVGGIIRAITD